MKVLVDTNILTRSSDPADKDYQVAVDAVAALKSQGNELCLVPQNYYEFWVVSTRPTAQNGRGKSPDEVVVEFAFFKARFTLLGDSQFIFGEWENLVSAHRVIGKTAHDARLVAAMQVHAVTHLLTFNDADFRRYTNITAISPASVISGASTP
jgi:predicted nucleic acid-binding protein